MKYPFGQDFVYEYYPIVADDAFTPSDTSLTPALYLFTDSPDRAKAAAGTGAVWSGTTWTWNGSKRCFSFTIAAVDDPGPTSTNQTEDYYLAINVRLQASEQIQTTVQRLLLERVLGHDSTAAPTVQEVAEEFTPITSYAKESEIYSYILKAQEDVRDALKVQGYQWARIHSVKELKRAVTFKAVLRFLLVAVQQGGDKFVFKYNEYKELYTGALATVQFLYDSDGDGVPDAEAESGSSTIWVAR